MDIGKKQQIMIDWVFAFRIKRRIPNQLQTSQSLGIRLLSSAWDNLRRFAEFI